MRTINAVGTIISMTFLLITHVSNAQSSCDDVKKENEYLKKSLQITTPTKTVTSDKIDFNLIKCEGNTKEQTVELVLTLVNHDANRVFQFSHAKAIDMEANEFETYKIFIGSGESRNDIYTDTPVKTIIRFSKVLPSVKMFKLVPIAYWDGRPGHTTDIQFKDLTITWK